MAGRKLSRRRELDGIFVELIHVIFEKAISTQISDFRSQIFNLESAI